MGRTIPEHFKELAEKIPDQEMFVFYDKDMKRSSITFAEMYKLAKRFAHVLKQKGVKRHQVVCVALPSSLEIAVASYGVMVAGGMPMCNEVTEGKEDVFLHCINKSEAQMIIVRTNSHDKTWSTIKDKVTLKDKTWGEIKDDSMPGLTTVLLANRDEGSNSVQDFMTMLRNYPESFVNSEIEESDVCGIWLTSGTTGMPKLVMCTHLALSEGAYIEGGFIPGTADKRHFSNAPWSWGVASPFGVFSGNTRILVDDWNRPAAADVGKLFADILRKEEPEVAFYTPHEIEQILKHWDLKEKKIVNKLIIGGYPVNQAMVKWFLSVVDHLYVRYGCSELLSISAQMISNVSDFKDFDCGWPCKGTRVKALDENMKEVPKGQPGRLLLNSWGVFKGYFNDKAKTDEALTKDGWFLTSDAGYIDENGHLIVVGRYDYVIEHKGKVYYPTIIEKAIQKLPGIKTAVVVPVPSKENHHNACACVVLQPDSHVTEADVKKVVIDRIKDGATNMIEPAHVIFLDEIKVNERGKMNTNELINMAKKTINSHVM